MLESIRKMWKIEELRKKILYTFFMLVIFRLVGVIPAPGVDVAKVMSQNNTSTLPLLELVNMMTGNAFSQMTIMAMGITPYINASIYLNIKKAVYNENDMESIQKLVEEGKYIVDIREIDEYKETGVIKEANLLPLSTFRKEYTTLPKDKDIYFYCKSGGRALLGMTYVQRAGYKNKLIVMRGGMTKTIQEGYPLIPYSK